MTKVFEDELAHYGKKGMKWGQRRKQRDTDIKDARARQRGRKDELKGLKKEKLRTSTEAGRKHLDSVISDKKYVFKNGGDAALAKKSTTGKQVLKGTLTTALLSTSAMAVFVAAQVGTVLVEASNALADSSDQMEADLND